MRSACQASRLPLLYDRLHMRQGRFHSCKQVSTQHGNASHLSQSGSSRCGRCWGLWPAPIQVAGLRQASGVAPTSMRVQALLLLRQQQQALEARPACTRFPTIMRLPLKL